LRNKQDFDKLSPNGFYKESSSREPPPLPFALSLTKGLAPKPANAGKPSPNELTSKSIPMTKPYKILGIQQIAIGGTDKNALRKLWVDTLGLTVTGNFVSERENVDEDICSIGSGPHKIEVDLMQPLDPDRKPAVHATPLNHVGLWVDDLPKAVEWMSANGVRFAPGGIRKGAAGYDICFIHPKGNDEFPIGGEGVLIELVQAPAEVVAALG